jgi:murein DD-endopeptidase MepM/ murein hydrolase activator NlpD
MKPPFSLLVTHGDGSRILRFWLPRPLVYGTLGLVGAVGLAGLLVLQGQWDRMAALDRRVGDQREIIDSFDTRMAAVRDEIGAWKVLHARMWDAFGPVAGAMEQGAEADAAAPGEADIAGGVKLDSGEEIDRLTTAVAEEGPRVRELERVVSRTGHLVSGLPLGWPIRGQIKSEFGMRRSPWNGRPEHHEGLDIGGQPGTPVESPGAATVVEANSHGDFGKHVTLDHGHGVRSLYGHMRKLEVKVGQRVAKGQVIGLVGSTGRSTGPHLHYEVLVEGRPVDPSGFLLDR